MKQFQAPVNNGASASVPDLPFWSYGGTDTGYLYGGHPTDGAFGGFIFVNYPTSFSPYPQFPTKPIQDPQGTLTNVFPAWKKISANVDVAFQQVNPISGTDGNLGAGFLEPGLRSAFHRQRNTAARCLQHRRDRQRRIDIHMGHVLLVCRGEGRRPERNPQCAVQHLGQLEQFGCVIRAAYGRIENNSEHASGRRRTDRPGGLSECSRRLERIHPRTVGRRPREATQPHASTNSCQACPRRPNYIA